ncbi:MAG: signal recognition particle [Devosia sp.]|nr:signal recognition particle [Devosia sp.]
MTYVDAYLFAVPKSFVDTYRDIARDAATVWKELGALSYVEALAEDVPYGELTSFPRAVQQTDDETVVLSYIVFADRASRDAINDQAMKDPRMQRLMSTTEIDMKRMVFGGFVPFVEL